MFSVVTDTSHTAGLTMHATILAYMFGLVETDKITAPLNATEQSANNMNNMNYVQGFVANLLKNAFPHHPMFIYQVSGEFAMLHHAAAAGAINLETTLMEVLTCMRRAGVDVVISYFTPKILEMIKKN